MQSIKLNGAEKWREYEWKIPETSQQRVYRIEAPVEVHVGETTHRVVDASGIAHCVPKPGHFGCVLRWEGPVVA